VLALALALVSCANAPSSVKKANAFEPCPIDPERFVTIIDGDAPIVLSSTHAGTARPQGCDLGSGAVRELATRQCSASLDMACESGPCRAAGPDDNARDLTLALRDDLARCLGKSPSLAMTEVARDFADMNRDVEDEGGPKCAVADPAARPLWEAYHRALERLVVHAADEAGDRALLVDLHTFADLPKATPPAILLGTGEPVGLTTPHQASEDASLPLLYGASGLRARLVENLAPTHPGLAVLPSSSSSSPEDLAGLFLGRYVVRRYSRTIAGETKEMGPAIDAVQIEVSRGLRDDVDHTAAAIASAICGAYGERLLKEGT
jgi:hypothetical protein